MFSCIGCYSSGLVNAKGLFYTLLSYKSMREPFDAWAMKELIGHYVSYRKQISPDRDQLLPEEQFQLYAVSTRYPETLSKQVPFQVLSKGVYEVLWGTDKIRLIVLSRVPKEKHNAIWKLFSANPDHVRFAAGLLRGKLIGMSQAINQVFEQYELEGIDMPYTEEDFERDYVEGHLDLLSFDARLKGVPTSEMLKRIPTSERLEGLSPEEIRKYLEQLEKE